MGNQPKLTTSTTTILVAVIGMVGSIALGLMSGASAAEKSVEDLKTEFYEQNSKDRERIAKLEEAVDTVKDSVKEIVELERETRAIYFSQILPVLNQVKNR